MNSTAAMRIARAVSSSWTAFPQLSDDPLEQFLIVEAVMARYEDEVHAVREREHARQQAQEAAQAMLDQARGG